MTEKIILESKLESLTELLQKLKAILEEHGRNERL